MFTVIASLRGRHQVEHQEAFAEGLSKIGIQSVLAYETFSTKTNFAACWGWRKGKELRDKGHNVVVMERGYIGDRFKYTSLGWNGLNGYATFPNYPDDGGDRFRSHGGIIKPWKKHGEYILILGQVKGDASLQNKDISQWYRNIAKQAYEIYGLPVYFRPHPESIRRGGYTHVSGIENKAGTLEDALSGALFTIAYNSNSCLDSILSGVPCFAGDKGTMAWGLCMDDIGSLEYPEREKIAHSISWTQWTLDEIRTGEPIRKLMECKQLS